MCILVAAFSAAAQGTTSSQTKKINKKNLVVKAWNVGTSGTKTLDHLTIYSQDGKKIEETEFDSVGKQKWRKKFEWGANGKMARELVYDERNKLVNYKTFEYNEFGKKKVQYTYNAKGKLTGTKTYEYLTQDE